MISANRPETRLATRLSFLVAGFGIAAWAPLVPFAKDRLAIDDGTLGLLLLCIGIGSIAAMMATGPLSTRYGSRPIILFGGFGLALLLPFLAIADSTLSLGLALLGFGAALGSIDVAMNIHAVDVEKASSKPLMSGFHALFSIGGFLGATVMTFLLSLSVGALEATLVVSAAMILAMLIAGPRLLRATNVHSGPIFALPRGIVLMLAALAAITFLVEGAILDWSALLISDLGLVERAQGGLAYMFFAIAMTVGRLVGDRVTQWLGDRRTMRFGGILAVSGFALALLAPIAPLALTGFVLIGLGASNIVPILFRLAGAQTVMPTGLAVAAITTVGYAGILVGPAGIGAVAHVLGLPASFWILAALLAIVPFCARAATAVERR